MIDNAIKKYLQNAFNKANIGSVSGEILNIERYFKLPFIGMYSKVTQNKIEKHCKNFAKMPKFDLFSLVINCVRHLSTRILFHMFSVQRQFINLFVLAVTLVMLVKHTNISQPGLMNTLVRIKSYIYTKIYCQMLVHGIVFLFQILQGQSISYA